MCSRSWWVFVTTLQEKMNKSFRTFDFERQFDDRVALDWFQQNCELAFIVSITYAVVIFAGRAFMKNRQKLDLRVPLVFWSLSLTVFSLAGTVRTVQYSLDALVYGGFQRLVCDTGFYSGPFSKFWAFAFAISKVPELGDTLFIVLRKQRLIFLHWYHHITVLLYSWYSYRDRVAGGAIFMTMNYWVHLHMYGYYTARAAGWRLPRVIAVTVTLMQILQMVLGLMVLGFVFRWQHTEHCRTTELNLRSGSLMYLSYLLLFCHFFYSAYLQPSTNQRHLKSQ